MSSNNNNLTIINNISLSLTEIHKNQGISIFALLGSVSSGKTSICKLLTTISTQMHSNELINGCTINLGYTNLKIYYNKLTNKYLLNPPSKSLSTDFELIRHFSIADNPGHNSFLATMITGTTNLDSVLFLISSVNEIEPQTYQHFRCFKSTNCKQLAILISKVDLIMTEMKLYDIINKIDDFLNEEQLSSEYDPPIIPISAIKKYNLDMLIQYLLSIPYPKNNLQTIQSLVDSPTRMSIIRSFDINKPGVSISNMFGAVVGGVIQSGFLATNDLICILPGIIESTINPITELLEYTYSPLISQVVELRSDTTKLNIAIPGGFIAVRTLLDPSLSKSNGLIGQTIIKISSIDDILKCNYFEINNLLNVIDLHILDSTQTFILNMEYIVVVNTSAKVAIFTGINNDIYTFQTQEPLSIFDNVRVAILNKTDGSSSIIAYGYSKMIKLNAQPNFKLRLQSNINEFIASHDNSITNITLIDDLPSVTQNDTTDLYDIEKMIKNINFVKEKFTINYPLIELHKTTTSFTIINAADIFLTFSDDMHNINMFLKQFAEAIQTKYVRTLKTNTFDISEGHIKFLDVKRVNTNYYINEFNALLNDFIKQHFTCNTCKMFASMFFTKKQHYCKSCSAVSMIKH